MQNWQSLSQAERDGSYDNNRAVTNSAELIADRNAASALFRAAHAQNLDVPYAGKERTKFDLYPATDPSAPCLVFIHGGYWQRNRREDFAAFAAGVMAQGWSVAMPGYTLCPDATLSNIVAEIDQSLTWLTAHGSRHGLAGGPIIVSGWSAGAHLAALALSHSRVTSAFAISGVYDLAPIRETYLNEKLHLSDIEIANLSPLSLAPIHKPLALIYGTHELAPLREDSRALHAKRAAAHCPGPLIPIAHADHFSILQQLQSPDSELIRQLVALTV